MNKLLGSKNIFSNQVSRRDLFTSSSERNESQNSSQFDFTQQDINYSSESVESQGIKMFDGYTNSHSGKSGSRNNFKQQRSLSQSNFTDHSVQKFCNAAKPTFQQQIELKKAQLRERDDRELMNTVLQTVKDCSDEVKQKLRLLCNNLDEMFGTSDDRVKSSIDTVLEAVRENYSKVVSVIQSKDDTEVEIQKLKDQLCQRDAAIGELQLQMEKQKVRNENNVMDQLKKLLEDHETKSSALLQSVQNSAQQLLENQRQIIDNQLVDKDCSSNLLLQLQKSTTKTETSLLNHWTKIHDDIEKQKVEMHEVFGAYFQRMQNKQIQEMRNHLQTELEKFNHVSYENNKEFGKVQTSQLKEIMQSEHQTLEKYIKSQVQEQITNNLDEYENNKKYDCMEDKRGQNTNFHKVSPQFAQDENVNTKYKSNFELEKLHSHIKRLERNKQESCQSAIRKDTTVKILSNSSPKASMWLDQTSTNKQDNMDRKSSFRKPLSFVSPSIERSKWNPEYFFNKPNPSPVATVLPQPQDVRPQRKTYLDSNCDYENGNYCQNFSSYPLRRSQRLASMNVSSRENSQTFSTNYDENPSNNETNQRKNVKCYQGDFESNVEKRQTAFQAKQEKNMCRIGDRQTTSDHRINHTNTNGSKMEYRRDRDVNIMPTKCQRRNLTEQYGFSNSNEENNARRDVQFEKQNNAPNVYEFSDEVSPLVHKPQKPWQQSVLKTRHQNIVSTFNSDGYTYEGDDNGIQSNGSNSSSPCLSVTQIFIKRKRKQDQYDDTLWQHNKKYNSDRLDQFDPKEFNPNYKLQVGDFIDKQYVRGDKSANDRMKGIFSISRSSRQLGKKRKLYDSATELMEFTVHQKTK